MKTVITGTSRGIGLALTEAALKNGDTVFAVSRSPRGLDELRAKFKTTLIPIEADVSTSEGRAKILKIVEAAGGLDTLINNAGILRKTDTEKDLEESFHLNAIVPFLMTTVFLPLLKSAKAPRVVQISTLMSSMTDNSSGGFYSYRASKAALNMLTKSFAIDHPSVRFAVLHPGWVKTEMGGEQAPIETKESAEGLWKVIHGLELTANVKLQDFRGRELPW